MDAPTWRMILPHGLLWLLVIAAVVLLVVVLWPVAASLLLAAAVAVLTEPVVFQPVDALIGRRWPHLDLALRRRLAALAATVLLGSAALAASLAVLLALLGSWTAMADAVLGIALQDPVRIAATADLAGRQVEHLARLYGGGAVDGAVMREAVNDLMTQTRVGAEFLHFLVSGTGGFIARAALVLVTVFYLFSQGRALTGLVVCWLPFDAEAVVAIERSYRATVYHLLAHVLGRAAVLGIGMGLIAWLVGGLNGVLVAVAAALFALLPLVGPMVTWIPLAGLVWSRGDPATAVALGLAGLAWCWVVDWLFRQVAARLGTDQLWLEFLLFLGLVGGLLAYGPAGLAIGPAAVLAAVIAARSLRQVYWHEAQG